MPSDGEWGGGEAAERRVAVRVGVAQATCPVSCRMLPGEDVCLLNISPYGVLIETRRPLAPGRAISLLVGRAPSAYRNVDGRVTRCAVAALCATRGLRFHAGVAVSLEGSSSLRDVWAWMLEAVIARGVRGAQASYEAVR